ncbi:hypothetical protein EP51_43485 (plasmid) [Rhodococcus opacus]|uniref:Uncharacterized protein n=1 Tax=Rhodococcus opacus TaxID=37919 RepID=A0A076EYW3_RHOOP|nr:hypothetical protein EP51_43485 [Rhodococcus opacus]
MGDLRAAFGSEQIEESAQGGGVAALRHPHQPARIVIDDHRQVLVALLVRDLIDPDPPQGLERS